MSIVLLFLLTKKSVSQRKPYCWRDTPLQTAHVQQKSDADDIADSWGITYYKMVLEVVTVFDNFKTVLLMRLVILMKKITFLYY